MYLGQFGCQLAIGKLLEGHSPLIAGSDGPLLDARTRLTGMDVLLQNSLEGQGLSCPAAAIAEAVPAWCAAASLMSPTADGLRHIPKTPVRRYSWCPSPLSPQRFKHLNNGKRQHRVDTGPEPTEVYRRCNSVEKETTQKFLGCLKTC